jgi:hypothetical protein
MKWISCFLFFFVVIAQSYAESASDIIGKPRYWTSKSGQKIAAKFVSFEQDEVFLKTRQGEEIHIKLDKLSVEDQQLVRSTCSPDTSSVETSESSLGNTAPVFTIPSTPSKWDYHVTTNEMSDAVWVRASINSENTVNFQFPYEGGSRLSFNLLHLSKNLDTAYICIDNGQFVPDSVIIRFDDAPAIILQSSPPSDGSTDQLSLSDFERHIPELRNASVMKIQPTFYSEGSRIFTFDVSGLEWPF